MGYFDDLTKARFRKDRHGDMVFYPNGAMGRGRVLPDPAKAEQIRKFILRFYFASCAVVALPFFLYCRFAAFHSWIIFFMVWLLWGLVEWFGTRTLLAGLPFSDERLKQKEILKDMAARVSRFTLWLQFLTMVLLVSVCIWMAVAGHTTHDVLAGIWGVICFGAWGAVGGYMLKVKPA